MEINIYQVLFQILNFGVILWVLTKYLYKPVLKMLDDRAKKINDGMAAAEKNLRAEAEVEKTKKAELSKARKDAAAILSAAESDARKKADEIIQKAHDKAKEEVAKLTVAAKKELENDRAKLQKEAVSIAGALAKKALENTLTAKEIETITSKMLKA